ncbi:ATP-binding cassette domain-containing protein [Sporosarcina sp. ACRSL]|uniref:ATP-binding cassette domain-containing protein n=1 Tax=Sporosarcina sp. ACRSL TaxID=2918215 RepID=UPI001EF41223|nr:ATP-binding cassette domain-containing protein [Sporosarcina sp. ACRSL]MCG7345219.1 ATP-binding cassette domain-containing protein [Sporosarcina sp. ACRSL]
MLEVNIKKQLAHYDLEVNFSMGDEILVLFGPSGSGKTTILHTIAGLTQPDEGFIKLRDKPFFTGQGSSVSVQDRNVGVVFQDYALFPHKTVEQNIRYGMKRKTGERSIVVEQLLQVLGIQQLLSKYPHQISGGEKQRTALARALAVEPSILLLDEPLSALDKQTRIECQNELLRLHVIWKIPFIIVTHDMEEAEKLGDRILFLEQGKIIEERTK